jgi:gliding motility-associated lipoprotein GldH
MVGLGAFFTLFLLVVGLTSCGKKLFYDDVQALPKEGWSKNQKLRFNMEVNDTTSTFQFAMHIRNDLNYRYSNVYFFLETQFPNGNITRDTLECIVADPYGKWLGSGYGNLRQNLIVLNPSIKFPLTGQYTFNVEHAMREDVLEGIADIGLRVERNPN